jgi:hypothetical protein
MKVLTSTSRLPKSRLYIVLFVPKSDMEDNEVGCLLSDTYCALAYCDSYHYIRYIIIK